MAINQITYSNKSDINTSATPATNKVSAADMNEIKSIVNTNATLMGDVSTLDTTATNLVGAVNEIVNTSVVTTGSSTKKTIQFSNGLMINTMQVPYSNVAVSTAWGSIYASSSFTTGDYQTPFVELYDVNINAKPSGGNHWFMMTEDSINELTYAPKVQFLRGASGQATGILYVTAIGTWK